MIGEANLSCRPPVKPTIQVKIVSAHRPASSMLAAEDKAVAAISGVEPAHALCKTGIQWVPAFPGRCHVPGMKGHHAR